MMAERKEPVMTPPRSKVALSICPLTTPKKIDRGDGRGCAEKGSQRCEQRGRTEAKKRDAARR